MSRQQHYSSRAVGEYWQYVWDRENVFELPNDAEDPTYVLGMFPYTSGALHMGHVRNYAITDAYARYRRMQGEDVLHPMGWDAFGLPAENAAHDHYTDPESWTRSCIEGMREEMESLGFGYDWSREITTCDPDYYRWNQWLFTRFYEAGLVEYTDATVNWCPDCETVLADAQVETLDGTDVCWRCETPVTWRDLDQWFFTITDYAEELHDGLDDLDGWPEGVRGIQRNWIGRQEGAQVTFDLENDHGDVDVFTTRLDTIHGATYLALAPGHDLAEELAAESDEMSDYVDAARDREGGPAHVQEGGRDPEATTTGVDTGLHAIHPLTGERLPVYVAAYVLDEVGTGAVMGVPAHNERDHAFARANDLPIEQVIEPVGGGQTELPDEPFTDDGMVTGSGEYDGLASAAARDRLLADYDAAEETVTYRLRDWLVSRQRYWGTPIPIVHCEDCGHMPVPDEDLPVELPEYVETTGNPLEAVEDFVETDCPECGRTARRETDTMDTFVDSSWYFLRYLSPDYEEGPFDPDRADEWMPVDVYVGGEEHAVLHLLYIRFFARVLSDLGLLSVREPVEQLRNQGTVLHEGEKMSMTKNNVIAPHEYGAETTRLFVLSAAHPERDFEWTARDVGAAYDLMQTLYGLASEFTDQTEFRHEREPPDEYLAREIGRTIAAVTDDYERFRFHRVSTEVRSLARLLRRYRGFTTPHKRVYRRGLRTLAALIGPITPYLGEEMWNLLRGEGPLATAPWPIPEYDVSEYRIERQLVSSTLDDVREITDVVDIDAPDRIELVVAPDWKFRAYDLAREADPGDPVVGRIMADEETREHGDAAADYAATLEDRQAGLEPVVDGDRELAILERARWLLVDEFGAEVAVRRGSNGDDLARKAEPNRPAIHIE